MFNSVQTSLETFFKNNWSHTAIVYENTPLNSELYTEFVRLAVMFASAAPSSIGNRCYRYWGNFTIQIFVKPGSGSARILQLTDYVSSLLRSQTVNSIVLGVPVVVKIPQQEASWVQVNVLTDFYFEEFAS